MWLQYIHLCRLDKNAAIRAIPAEWAHHAVRSMIIDKDG